VLRWCMNVPFARMFRRVKAPQVPRRLGGEEEFTSSERVGGAEEAVGLVLMLVPRAGADIS